MPSANFTANHKYTSDNRNHNAIGYINTQVVRCVYATSVKCHLSPSPVKRLCQKKWMINKRIQTEMNSKQITKKTPHTNSNHIEIVINPWASHTERKSGHWNPIRRFCVSFFWLELFFYCVATKLVNSDGRNDWAVKTFRLPVHWNQPFANRWHDTHTSETDLGAVIGTPTDRCVVILIKKKHTSVLMCIQ